jgi:hypothetical protein
MLTWETIMLKSMIKASLIAASLSAASLASAGPGMGAVNTLFKARFDFIEAQSENGSIYLWAGSYDDFRSGSPGGTVGVYSGSGAVICDGPSMAGALSLNPATGMSTVSAALDPTNPDCQYHGISLGKITVNLRGAPDGIWSSSGSGPFVERYDGQTIRSNASSASWSKTFTGDTILGFSAFMGKALTQRFTDRTQVK